MKLSGQSKEIIFTVIRGVQLLFLDFVDILGYALVEVVVDQRIDESVGLRHEILIDLWVTELPVVQILFEFLLFFLRKVDLLRNVELALGLFRLSQWVVSPLGLSRPWDTRSHLLGVEILGTHLIKGSY